MFDLLIRNARIVDGTGAAEYNGDIAVSAGLIAAISANGELSGAQAKDVIDADGQLVAPGWVDVHSHFDGQATWDPLLSPAANHGTTTVVMGNCGIGFAPCKPDPVEHDRLIAVVEDVEDIPGAALHEGVAWNWETFPEYLDALDQFPRAIDIGAQVPHCAVRTYVMGERGTHNEKATPEDVEKMAAIVKEGLQAGALGFTTSRTSLHTTREGEVMPGTYADESELLGIGRTLGEIQKGVYGLVSDFDDWEVEMDWMKRLALETGRPVNFVLFFRKDEDWPRVQKQLAYVKEAVKEGAQLIPHVGARPVNILMGWDATVNPFMFHQNFGPLMLLSQEERFAKLSDTQFRQLLMQEEVPQTGDEFLDSLINDFDKLYVLGTPPNYEPGPEDSIQSKADAAGVDAREYAYDAMLENNGKNLLYFPCFGYGSGDLSRQIAMLEDENSVISLADGGAHCGVLADISVPTYLLSYLVRDRKRGKTLELPWAVKLHTRDTARCVGLGDRGTLEVGMKADINIIDFDRLQVTSPEIIYDLPAGGRRVYQGAVGYTATIVSGEVIYRNGVETGARPGKLVRGTQEAPQL